MYLSFANVLIPYLTLCILSLLKKVVDRESQLGRAVHIMLDLLPRFHSATRLWTAATLSPCRAGELKKVRWIQLRVWNNILEVGAFVTCFSFRDTRRKKSYVILRLVACGSLGEAQCISLFYVSTFLEFLSGLVELRVLAIAAGDDKELFWNSAPPQVATFGQQLPLLHSWKLLSFPQNCRLLSVVLLASQRLVAKGTYSIAFPDRRFHNFRASKSVDQRFRNTLRASIDIFSSFKGRSIIDYIWKPCKEMGNDIWMA